MTQYIPTDISIERIGIRGLGFQLAGKSYFCVNHDMDIIVYENVCPHFGVKLETVPDRFLNSAMNAIECSRHSALFDIKTGICHRGPCEGDTLIYVKSKVVNDMLWVVS